MAGTLRTRNRKAKVAEEDTAVSGLDMENPSSDIEIYASEVLGAMIADNLPPTPNNFSLYFDRLLEDKSENLRQQIHSMLELEESNDAESTIILEQSLKQGFGSIKNILGVTANLYKNMTLMGKILDKRQTELAGNTEMNEAASIIKKLSSDVSKLNNIVKTQSTQMKGIYDDTAKIVKNVENETIFDNQFGVYNKRYFLTKIKQEIGLIKEFKHTSSLILLELSKELKESVNNEKANILMTRTIARLLLKTSRRSDVVAHYGSGIFGMVLKHTSIESAIKTSERLCQLVSSSNFFLADREVQLKISIGVTDIDAESEVEEVVVSAMNGIEEAYTKPEMDYAVVSRKK